MKRIVAFLREEENGQDLSEYCLLTALLALIAAGIFIHAAGGVQNLWSVANQTLANGNSTVAGGGPAGAQPSGR